MDARQISNLIEANAADIAFIGGNGMNLHAGEATGLSWDALVRKLWARVSGDPYPASLEGISMTEMYDIIDVRKLAAPSLPPFDLQRAVKDEMMLWQPSPLHGAITARAESLGAPLLTTNFDEMLSGAAGCRLLKMPGRKFTDYYPWSSYFGRDTGGSDDPAAGFGIWHINGMIHYHRSIRLGLCHYMGSVDRARGMIGGSLFRSADPRQWSGRNTWLNVIFNRSLLVFGLALDENETFLRWLLIQRRKYFLKYPSAARRAWYVCRREDIALAPGKRLFLESVGFEVIETGNYCDIYNGICR